MIRKIETCGFYKTKITFAVNGGEDFVFEYDDKELAALFTGTKWHLDYNQDIHPSTQWYDKLIVNLHGGYQPRPGDGRRIVAPEITSHTRRDLIVLLLRTLLVEKIPGDMLEVGVYRGWSAALIHHYIPERELFLFDTFEGFTDRCLKSEKQETGWDYPQGELSDTSLEIAMKNVDAENGNVHWFKGYFPDTWPAELNDRRFAFVHFDPDLYEPIHKGLELVYPRMVRHGMILVHDYMNLPGAFKAVNDFFSDKPEVAIPMPDKTGSALIVKE